MPAVDQADKNKVSRVALTNGFSEMISIYSLLNKELWGAIPTAILLPVFFEGAEDVYRWCVSQFSGLAVPGLGFFDIALDAHRADLL